MFDLNQRPTLNILPETPEPFFRIPTFLSIANPFNDQQRKFLNRVIQEMLDNLLLPRTLGVGEQGYETPLTLIRRIVFSSYGCLAIAFRRVQIINLISRPGTPDQTEYSTGWLTSPYIQIEASMAYQQGLPLLILRENGVVNDGVLGGILEPGAAPLFIPFFNVDTDAQIEAFFNSIFWRDPFLRWVADVREYFEAKTEPLFAKEALLT
jgi:hypothetical protein